MSEGRVNVDIIVDGFLWMLSCYGVYGNFLKLVRVIILLINLFLVELYMYFICIFVDVVLC